MRKVSLLIIAALFVMPASVCLAGKLWRCTCTNSECRFEGKFGDGGGWSCDKVAGYCTTCKEFVSIQWDNGNSLFDDMVEDGKNTPNETTNPKVEGPEQAGTVWSLVAGEKALYPCPKCKKPFMVINDVAPDGPHTFVGLSCPRCGKKTLKLRLGAMYD